LTPLVELRIVYILNAFNILNIKNATGG